MKLLIVLLFLISCAKDPVSMVQTNNSEFNVALLFENDGCKVYRFIDAGNYRYYTNCTEVIWTETHNCGKNCNRTEHHSIGNK